VGYDQPCWTRPEEGQDVEPWMHPGRSLVGSLRGAEKGVTTSPVWLAELEPGLHRPLGLTAELAGEVVIATLSLDALLASQTRASGYRPIPRLPGNKVDVALAMPLEVPAGAVLEAIEKSGKGLVRTAELFDVYSGPGLAEGTRSLAYHVLLQSDTKTVTDAEAQKFFGRLERAAGVLGGELRRE
jgi:phenylalanyl-tRNA synthetase beta chain